MTALLRQPRHPTGRFAVLLVLLGLCGLAVLVLPRPDLDRVPQLLDRLGPLAPAAPVVIGALLLIALVPRTFVSLAWGAIFGPVSGAGYALAAALLAATLGFWIGRLLGRDFVLAQLGAAGPDPDGLAAGEPGAGSPGGRHLADRLRARLARLDGWLSRTSVLGVMVVRLLPIGGFGLVSYGYGTSGARLAPYLVGSMIASTPSAIGYAAVGAAVASPASTNWLAITPAGVGLVVTAVLVARWRKRARPSPR